jgi:hypothetical protein
LLEFERLADTSQNHRLHEVAPQARFALL